MQGVKKNHEMFFPVQPFFLGKGGGKCSLNLFPLLKFKDTDGLSKLFIIISAGCKKKSNKVFFPFFFSKEGGGKKFSLNFYWLLKYRDTRLKCLHFLFATLLSFTIILSFMGSLVVAVSPLSWELLSYFLYLT